MTDLEKTIRGLQCHSEPKFGPDEYFCETCPYDEATCGLDVPNDALSLLKAQEPRVMTLEEVAAAEVGWVQDRDADELYAVLIIDVYADDTVGIKTADEDLEYWLSALDYNKKWRCWTACPTEEQREAVPWNA